MEDFPEGISFPLGAESALEQVQVPEHLQKLVEQAPDNLVTQKLQTLSPDQLGAIDDLLNTTGDSVFAFKVLKSQEEQQKAVALIDQFLAETNGEEREKIGAEIIKLLE